MTVRRYQSYWAILMSIMAISVYYVNVPADDNIWATNGPEGGYIFSIAIHPRNHLIVYIGSIGIFKSIDGGEAWIHIAPDAFAQPVMRTVAIHPFGPDTMYATATQGMYKSVDAGQTWELLPNPDGPNMEYRPFVIHPVYPNILFSAGFMHGWKSTDGGQNWSMMLVPGPDPRFIGIESFAIDPVHPNIIYLAGCGDTFMRALFKSMDYGETWLQCQNNIDSSGCGRKIVVDPVNSDILYFARGYRLENTRCLWKSTNGGNSWSDITPAGMQFPSIDDILVMPENHDIVFASTDQDGILKSTDGGLTWASTNQGLRGRIISKIAVDTVENALYLGTYGDGIYKSTDEGATWRPISYNINQCYCNELAINAFDPQAIFVTAINGPFVSIDGGQYWRYSQAGLPLNSIAMGIAFDELLPQSLYMSLYHRWMLSDLPGFARTTDLGNSWTYIDNGLPGEIDYGQIAISYLGGDRRIFLASSRGLYSSDDSGLTWALCAIGLPADTHYESIAIAPSNPNIIAAGEGYDLQSIQNHVYISTDRGGTWSSATPLPERREVFIDDIKFDPTNDNHFFVIYFGFGFFETTDRGQSWSNITSGIPIDPAYPNDPWLSGFAINPADSSDMFILSCAMGIYQSHDGGRSWQSFNVGFDTTICYGKIHFVPGDTTKLFIATAGRSVWSIHRTVVDAVDDATQLPDKIALSVYPNPFNSSTTIRFSISAEGPVALEIYDILGRKVETLSQGVMLAGSHALVWDATGYTSGVYFLALKTGESTEFRRLLLLK